MLTLCYKLFRNIIVKKIFPMVKVKIVLLIMVGELTNANAICNISRTIIMTFYLYESEYQMSY